MKRIGNLFNRIISYENLVRLQKALIEDTYRTSEYCVYTIIADRGNKEREIYRLPYYPDRIVHHAIMNVIEPYLVNRFTADTFNCLKGRGIHYGVKRLKRDLKADKEGTKYCLKLDIKKFFPSIFIISVKNALFPKRCRLFFPLTCRRRQTYIFP